MESPRPNVPAVSLLRVGLTVIALLAAGFIGGWAGRAALVPPPNPVEAEPENLVYTVGMDTVGRSLAFTAVAEWELIPLGRNGADGVVTSVLVPPGGTVDAGQVVYTVGLRPVVVGQGSVPMFRSLAIGTRGPDVAQLESLLAGAGLFSADPDMVFDSTTRTAVREWQDSLGVEDDGVVQPGDLVFVQQLPAQITFTGGFEVGARVAAGDQVLLMVSSTPSFRIPMAPEQTVSAPLAAEVEVDYPDGMWTAAIERAVETATGEVNLILTAPDGGPVCGETCADWVGLSGATSFHANIIVVPETTGPAVPVAAIGTDPDNDTFVTLADGTLKAVEIVASANGVAIVAGIDPGTDILVPSRES